MSSKVLFIDRDGTLIEEPHDNQVDALHKIRLVKDVIPALLDLAAAGYRFVMVSNQDGLGTSSFPEEDFQICQDHVVALFESQGIRFDEVFVCPHFEADHCECRKPRTGLLTKYLAANNIDVARSAVIGDRDTDVKLGERLGLRSFKVAAVGPHESTWSGIVDALIRANRVALVERQTRETTIRAGVNLDAGGRINVDTGIGFFDHMLEQIAKHGGFSLDLNCEGDLQIDEHHTVEDTAIVLGTALREALGDKRGTGRYGFLLPMDESEAQVAIDLSGRGNFEFVAEFPRDNVGELSTEMVEHFFRSLAESLAAAIHIEVEGENTHHMVEACFKAVGRSLRQAIRMDGSELPTTKGTLS
jgi:imidazoleglycerol-phosphate dehydratase/histidinol-phosphatase